MTDADDDCLFSGTLARAAKPAPSLLPQCDRCRLHLSGCRSPKMRVSGGGRLKILLVGERPGADEDRQGEAFVGPSGRLMSRVFSDLGADMYRDCWMTNAVICMPPGPLSKHKTAVADCRPNVFRVIRDLKPAVVVLLGGAAVKSVIDRVYGKPVNSAVARWAGWRIPAHTPNAWLCPTYNPAHLIADRDRDADDEGGRDVEVPTLLFRRHLAAALRLAARGVPWPDGPPDYKSRVRVIQSPADAAAALRRYTGGVIAFDFENSPLKPDVADADLVSCGVCWEGQETISFPWAGAARGVFLDLLENPDVGKIAHNLKHEQRWCLSVLGVRPRGWAFDSMQAAHALNPAARASGLKMQAFVRLGCPDYSSHLEPYLDPGDGKGGNDHNRVRQIDPRQLLLYGGLDALLAYEVAADQARELGVDL